MFNITKYIEPDFNKEEFRLAPNVKVEKVIIKGVAPENYHATSMYPEYFKVNNKWILAEQSRMDCVPVLQNENRILIKEFRNLEEGDQVILGRTEDGSEGIYLHQDGFIAEDKARDVFSFRNGRSRNKVRRAGSVDKFIEEHNVKDGVIYSCVKNNVPFVLARSIRDDGSLPDVFSNVYEAQDEKRKHTQRATTIICLATQLHTIATGNLTPSYTVVNGEIRPVFLYAIDVSEFVLNKLRDRGTLEATTIVSNVQDFLFKLNNRLIDEKKLNKRFSAISMNELR